MHVYVYLQVYICMCACMCGCMSVCVCGGRIARWLGQPPGNQKVLGSIPSVATLVLLLFPWARNFTPITPVYPAA